MTATTTPNGKSAADYRSEYWRMADALRGSMDAAEYKHVVLGLIFLKYVSAAFEEAHARLEAERDEGADPAPRILTSIAATTSSGCRPRRVGRTCRARLVSPPSGGSWTTR